MIEIGSAPQVYPWQQGVWQHLQERYPKLGHALLFYGKKGCGKHDFTQHFVQWLLCANPTANGACGQCQSCIWFKTDMHPHLMHIHPDEEEIKKGEKAKKTKSSAKIKIEKIREILPFVQQTLEGWRVIVIEPAEALNIASSNALLKTLEEPSERVIIILLAEHYLKLPATIRSRTQHFALDRIDPQLAQFYLQQLISQKNYQITEQQQQVLLNIAESMPLYALELAESEWMMHRAEFVQDWLNLLKYKDKPMFYATKWQKMMSFNAFNYMLEVIICDMIRTKLQQSVYNIDLNLHEIVEYLSLEQLFSLYTEIQHSKQSLMQNVQSQLFIDHYVMKMMNV